MMAVGQSRNRRWAPLVVGAVIVIGIAAWIVASVTAYGKAEHHVTVEARVERIQQQVVLAGLVTYSASVTVGAPQPGMRLTKTLVAAGSRVEKGAPLLEFEGARPGIEVRRRELALDRARLQAKRREEDPNADTTDLELAQLDVKVAEAELTEARELAGVRTVASPLTGVVIQVPDAWGVGNGAQAVTIAVADAVVVDAELDDVSVRQVRLGAEVAIQDGDRDGEIRTRVTTAPSLRRMRPQGAVYGLVVPIPARSRIPVGAAVKLKIVVEEKDTLVVPKSVIETIDGRTFVRVLRDGWVSQIEVKRGIESADKVEITQGLARGARVVIDGLFDTREKIQ